MKAQLAASRPVALRFLARLGAAALVVTVLTAAIGWLFVGSSGLGLVQPFDDAARTWTQAHFGAWTGVAALLAALGSTPIIFVASVGTTALVWLRTRDWRPSLLPLVSVLTADIVGAIAKMLVARPRPSGVEVGILERFSFPSGHTEAAAAFAAAICLLWSHERPRASTRVGLAAVALIACIVSFGRVVIDAHWATDVIVGCAVGFSSAAIAHWALSPSRRSTHTPRGELTNEEAPARSRTLTSPDLVRGDST